MNKTNMVHVYGLSGAEVQQIHYWTVYIVTIPKQNYWKGRYR